MTPIIGLLLAVCAAVAAGFATGVLKRGGDKSEDADEDTPVVDEPPAMALAEAMTPDVVRRSRLETMLDLAGVRIRPAQFVIICVIIGMVAGYVVWTVSGVGFLGLVAFVGIGSLPVVYVRGLQTKAKGAIIRSWPDAVMDIRSSIVSGRSMHQSLVVLSEHGPEPLRHAFSRYPTTARVTDTVTALEIIKEELADPVSDRVIEVLILAHERGGGIVIDVLDDLGESVLQDERAHEEIDSESLELRIQGWALVAMPWLLLFVLMLGNPQFKTFYQTGGTWVLVVGALLDAIGILIIRRLARQTVEPRVLVTEPVNQNQRG